jgi:hypothetical protein
MKVTASGGSGSCVFDDILHNNCVNAPVDSGPQMVNPMNRGIPHPISTVPSSETGADIHAPFSSPSGFYEPMPAVPPSRYLYQPLANQQQPQVQVSQVSQSWRADALRPTSRTNPHAYNADYRRSVAAATTDPVASFGRNYRSAAADDDAAVRVRRNPHQMNWWARAQGLYPQPGGIGPAVSGLQPNYSLPSSSRSQLNSTSVTQMSPNCNQVTSSTDMQQRPAHHHGDARAVAAATDDDDRLSSALNSICMADVELGFLESLSSLSMDSSTNPTSLSPTTLLVAEPNRLNTSGPRATATGPSTYLLDTVTSNMVVNDMGTALSQLQTEETNYYMTVRA